jgi:hypothetical protein
VQACKELGYSLDKMAEMLRPGGKYDPELLALVMRKTNCSDEGRIRKMLDTQARNYIVPEFFAQRHQHNRLAITLSKQIDVYQKP